MAKKRTIVNVADCAPRGNIEQLIEECEKLLALLKDPHPGLMSWQEMVARRRKNIWELP